MTRTSKFTTWGLLATFAATIATPVLANPNSQQKNKNQWRNLGVAGAVIAGYGLLKGNQAATVLGAAGAAYSANRYEKDRQSQSQGNTNNRRRYYRTYGSRLPVSRNNGYNNGSQWNNHNDYNNNDYNSSYDNSGYNNTGDSNGDQWNNHAGSYDSQNNYSRENNDVRHDNGQHRGWYKHGDKKQNKDRNDDRD